MRAQKGKKSGDVTSIEEGKRLPPRHRRKIEESGGDMPIEALRKLERADLKLKQAEMLLNVSRRVAAIETLDEVLATLVEMTTFEIGAERGTLFLNDPITDELYSRFAQGNFQREIRILNTSGVAGHVFQSGEGAIIDDAYNDSSSYKT